MWKILVVDDNPDILEAVSLVLSRKNMEVLTLEDPSVLHTYISQFIPDLLLMDIAMGNFDGRELCREIKSSPVEGNIPVILFSARNYSAESIKMSRADNMIEKPFRINELYDAVYRLLPKDQC
jgi:DNA-binding response OmpR family regulator